MSDMVDNDYSRDKTNRSWLSATPVLGQIRKTTPNGPEAQQLVRNALMSNFKYRRVFENSVSVPCPFHTSDSFSMTLSVNLKQHLDGKGNDIPVGLYRCWSCGSAGPWNRLAEHLSLPKLEETENPDLSETTYEAEWEKEYALPPDKDMSDLPSGWKWKRRDGVIEHATLVRAGARFHTTTNRRGEKNPKRLWLPANEFGEVVGHIDASLEKKPKLKYVNSEGPWALRHFYGFDEALHMSKAWIKRGFCRFCVLVEGPADQLYMLQRKIPAIACLGTNSFSEVKANLLISSFDLIIVVGDGDDPGREFNIDVRQRLRQANMPARIFKLSDGVDPASISEDEFDSMLEFITKHATKEQ